MISAKFKASAELLWEKELDEDGDGFPQPSEERSHRARPSISSLEMVADRLDEEYMTSITLITSDDDQVLFSNFLQNAEIKRRHVYVFYPFDAKVSIRWSFRHIEGKFHDYDKCLWKKLQKAIFKKVLFDRVQKAPSQLSEIIEDWLETRFPAYNVGSIRILVQKYYEPGNEVKMEHCELLREMSLNTKRDAERVIIIQTCHKKRAHSTCFKVFARNLPKVHQDGKGQPCQCCGFTPSVLLPRTFSATLHRASPLSQLDRIWPQYASDWMREQYTMIQYVVYRKYPNRVWLYADMFDGVETAPLQRTFHSLVPLLEFAEERHATAGTRRKSLFLEGMLSVLDRVISVMGNRGTFCTYKKQLERTIAKRIILWSQNELLEELGQELCLWAQTNITRRNHSSRKNVIYSYSGKRWTIAFAEPLLQASPSDNAQLVAKMMEFLFVMRHHFGYEVVSGGAFSLSLITYKAILFKLSTASETHEATSKPTLALLKLFKSKSLHQFLLPVMPFINSGERLTPFGTETLKSLLEADMTLCYSSQVALKSMPIGCPLLFQYDSEKKGLFGPKSHPYNRAEYKIVYHLLSTFPKPILQAHHQYSANGPFIAGYMSLDLLIVYSDDDGQPAFAAFNVHHNYTHTCEICGKLDGYQSKRSYESVKKKSDEIDSFWRDCSDKIKEFAFQTIYFCHFPLLIGDRLFQSLGELNSPPSQFPPDLKTSPRGLDEKRLKDLIKDPNLVVFVIGTGRQNHPGYTNGVGSKIHPANSLESACVFSKNERDITSLSTETKRPTLFLGDYLDFLITNRQFELERVFHVVIYRSSNAYQPIFRDMARARELNLPGSGMLKLALNSAIGLFGSCKTEATEIKLVFKSSSRRSWHSNYFLTPTSNPNVFLQERSFLRSTCSSYLIMVHTAILQNYRLAMLLAREELSSLFLPEKFRVLQVHADSFLIGMAEKKVIDCARNPKTFPRDMERIFSRKKRAGKFTICTFINSAPFSFFLPGVTKVNVQYDYFQAKTLPLSDRGKFLETYRNRYVGEGTVYDDNLIYYSCQ